jgi:hypothetical protein
MTTYQKTHNTKIVLFCVLVTVCVALLVTSIVVYATEGYREPKLDFDERAIAGLPNLSEEQKKFLQPLEIRGMAGVPGTGEQPAIVICEVGIFAACKVEGNELVVYFTNYERNEGVYLQLMLVNSRGATIASSELIRPGEHLRTLVLPEPPTGGHRFVSMQFKVIVYDDRQNKMVEQFVPLVFAAEQSS